MASNVSNRKPSSKQVKFDTPQPTRIFRQQPAMISINVKDSSKDKDKDKKFRSATLRSTNNTKQRSKRTEVTESLSRAPQQTAAAPIPQPQPTKAAPVTVKVTAPSAAAAAAAQPPATVKSATVKVPANDRQAIVARHLELAQHNKLTRKNKQDSSVTMAKPEDQLLNTSTRLPKESKSPDKAETAMAAAAAALQRPIRTKNHSHSSKAFFDKYFKFAYDLTQPDGVRQLEAHFFPPECKSKQQLKKGDAGDSPEK